MHVALNATTNAHRRHGFAGSVKCFCAIRANPARTVFYSGIRTGHLNSNVTTLYLSLDLCNYARIP